MRTTLAILLLTALLAVTGCQKKTPAERLTEAQQLLQERQTALAVIKMQQLVEDAPDDPASLDARLLLGQYFLQQTRDPAKARPLFEEVLKREGIASERGGGAFMGNLASTVALSGVDEGMKMIDAAQADSATPAEIADQIEMTRAEMLFVSREEARIPAALAALEKVMLGAADPALRGQAREQLAQFHRVNRDYTASNAVYERFLEKHPDDPTKPQLILAQAINLRTAGDEAAAQPVFDRGIAMLEQQIADELDKAERGRLQLAKAQYYDLFGNLDVAEKLMLAVMAENQGSLLAIQTQFAVGDMWRRHGHFDRALEVYERIKTDNPGTNVEAAAQGEIERTGQMREARTQAEAAAAEASANPPAAPAEGGAAPANPETEGVQPDGAPGEP
ncbi:MAG: hypothetical protein SF028_08800 [Candidatus Sumerlaeia bacterium]|nr:hypothetical protein [Candidatus Sumerlaeia bacterium]